MAEEPANVARFLAGVGEATEVPRRSPPRGPPYWKSRVLRRQALGDEDDGQGREPVQGPPGSVSARNEPPRGGLLTSGPALYYLHSRIRGASPGAARRSKGLSLG